MSKRTGDAAAGTPTKQQRETVTLQGALADAAGAFDEESFVTLLGKLIGETEHLQNNQRMGLVPNEARAIAHVMAALGPHTVENGGPLQVELLEYVEGRGNLKITYKGTTDGTVAFVGSHFDVVPANPEEWSRDPFKMEREGDRVYGRGVTDCLGHVAILTELLVALAKAKPVLKRSLVVIFIAGEEGGEKGVGIDMVMDAGKMSELKNGPVYWVDSADSQPCVGTAGVMQWKLKATGRLFHSGLPNKGINSIELANVALAHIQDRFYEDFPAHPDAAPYNFSCPTTMKPTQIECAKGSLNQICPWTEISGDIRLSPFYTVHDVVAKIKAYEKDVNENIGQLATRGPVSKFVLDLPDSECDVKQGKVEFEFANSTEDMLEMQGVACDMSSWGFQVLCDATHTVKGDVKPYAISGSLPLVRSMRDAGYDLQITGYGLSAAYHAVNEYADLKEMRSAFQIMFRIISAAEDH